MNNLQLDKWEDSDFSGFKRISPCGKYILAKIVSVRNLYYVDPNTEEEITFIGTIFKLKKNSKLKGIPAYKTVDSDKDILKFKLDLKLISMGYAIDKLGV